MWNDLPSPIIIAHRGEKIHAPENTLSAFELAVENGADAVEFDVQLTSDEHVIVLHDPKVDRTTDGTGEVRQFSLEALQELDAGSWFSMKFKGEKIPTLNEVFQTFGNRICMNIELKNNYSLHDKLILKVIDLIKKYDMEKHVLLSSFIVRNLRIAKKLCPDIPRGLLIKPGFSGFWDRKIGWRKDYYSLNPYQDDVNVDLVNQVHKAKKLLYVWTVNSKTDMERMFRLGVDGLITDDPLQALQLLGRRN